MKYSFRDGSKQQRLIERLINSNVPFKVDRRKGVIEYGYGLKKKKKPYTRTEVMALDNPKPVVEYFKQKVTEKITITQEFYYSYNASLEGFLFSVPWR